MHLVLVHRYQYIPYNVIGITKKLPKQRKRFQRLEWEYLQTPMISYEQKHVTMSRDLNCDQFAVIEATPRGRLALWINFGNFMLLIPYY